MNVERLTKCGYQFSLLNVLQGLTRYTEIDEILNQLAAYEDTGLSPADIADLRNELCLKCGKYKTAHEGSCDGCRWKEK